MGIVYEALDRESRARVAIKTLRSLDARSLRRLRNEFRTLQDIEHPNLVTLGELFEEDGWCFFSMELVEGVDFLSYVWSADELDPVSEVPRRDARVTRGAMSATTSTGLTSRG